MDIKLIENKEILNTLSENECFKDVISFATKDRDYIMAIENKKIIGFAVLYKKYKCKYAPNENVLSLSNIEVDDDFQRKGVGTKLLIAVIKEIKERCMILKRTESTEDGADFIYNKFTNMLERNKVSYIPHHLGFIYSILEKQLFQHKKYTNQEKINLMYEAALKIIKTEKCKRERISSIDELNSDFISEGKIIIESLVKTIL